MNLSLTKKRSWKSYLIVIVAMLMFSSSAFAVKICNESGRNMRLAVVTMQEKGFFSLECVFKGTNCYMQVHNFSRLNRGYCDTFSPGLFHWNYFVVQTQNNNGSWTSPIYRDDQTLLDGKKYGTGSSGFSGSVCLNENKTSWFYDRRVKGRIPELNKEECKSGYKKFPLNLITQGMYKTDFTLTLN